MQVRQKSVFGDYRDTLASSLARKQERIASGMNGEPFKYQSRSRKSGGVGGVHNCIGGKSNSLCLIGFLVPHNFLSESEQFFHMRLCPNTKDGT